MEMKELLARAEPVSSEIEILANAGSRMSFDADYVIDLNGIIALANDKQIPLLFSHNREKVVGYADQLVIDDRGIVLKGKLTTNLDETNDIRDSFGAGQKWQASLGFKVVECEEYDEGINVEVNGRIEEGPVVIARAIEIMECSIVSLGADSKTEIIKANDASKLLEASASVNININNNNELEEVAIEATRKETLMTEELNMNNNTRIASLALMMQAGLKPNERNYKEAELEAAEQLKHLDMRSVIEAASGWQPTHSQRSNVGEWLQAAASSYGLNNIITTVSSEMLMTYANNEREPWRQVFKITSCADTRPMFRYKIGQRGGYELKKVAAGAEFEHAVYDDAKATISADLYARQFCISEEEILAGNGINALADILRQSAAGAQDCIKNVLWKLFLNPVSNFDSTAFFHADHKNLVTSSPLTYANLAEGVAKFYECNGRGIDPKLLIVPASLWAVAQTLCKSTSMYTASGSGTDVNPIASLGLTPVAVPDLELSKHGGAYSNTTWYLAADPQSITAFEATFLNSNTTPRMRRQDVNIGFSGIKCDTSLIFGAQSLDPEGIVKFTA